MTDEPDDAGPYRRDGREPPEPASREEALGPLRSEHGPLKQARLSRVLLIGGVVTTVAAAAWTAGGLAALAVGAPCAALAALIVGYRGKDADARVLRHERGLVVDRRGAQTVALYDDVDEVWYRVVPLPSGSLGSSDLAVVHAARLALADGSTREIPLRVERAEVVVGELIRRCTAPLAADARGALALGEELTFGKVRLSRVSIAIGRASAPWREISLTRVTHRGASFFKRQRFVPWRSVAVDEVPHPTLFFELVRELAPKVEVERPNLSGRG